nr:transporter substrate-binding domain-containing protein [Duganella flavida]
MLVVSAFNSDAHAEQIVFSVSNDKAPPLAFFGPNGEITGILKDFGDEIARELGMQAKFVALPRRRLRLALADGSVDAICHSKPAWIPVPLNWSHPLLPNQNFILGGVGVAPISSALALKGEKIGTVMGYQYPELEQVLGKDFLRDDSPSVEIAIKKLMAARFRYVIVDKLSLEYRTKSHPEMATLLRLKVSEFSAMCGFSKSSKISFERMNAAVDSLIARGRFHRIISNYVSASDGRD